MTIQKTIIIGFLAIWWGCSENTPTYYGLELEDDKDVPKIVITSPSDSAFFASPNTIAITYDAADLSGIQSIDFYVNDAKIYTMTEYGITGKINWPWQNTGGITDKAKLQLRAVDNVGKESWSNVVTIKFDYTYFPMVDMSAYTLRTYGSSRDPLMNITGNNSVWFLLANGNLLQYKDSSFQECVLPAEPSVPYGTYNVCDYYVNRDDQKYLVYRLDGSEHYYLKYQNAGTWIRTKELGAAHDFVEDRNGVTYAVLGGAAIKFNGNKIDTLYYKLYNNIVTLGIDYSNNLYGYFVSGNVARIVSGAYQTLQTITNTGGDVKLSFDSANNVYIIAGAYWYKNSARYSISSALGVIDTQFGVISENEIWFSTSNGLGLYRNGQWKIYNSLNSNLKNFNHGTIKADNKGTVYICYGDIKKLLVIRK